MIKVFKISILILAAFAVPVYTADNVSSKKDIFEAIKEGNLEVVKNFIEKQGVEVDAKDVHDRTLLHYASELVNLKIVAYLIEKGANVNAKDKSGDTALHAAILKGCPQIVAYLIWKKANVNLKGSNGNPPLRYAAWRGNLEMVKYLIEKGADVNAKNASGDSPLNVAVRAGNLEMVKCLIKKGANVNAKDHGNRTALHYAATEGYVKIIRYLIKQGANCDLVRTKKNRHYLDLVIDFYALGAKKAHDNNKNKSLVSKKTVIDMGKLGNFVKKYLSDRELIEKNLGSIINLMQLKYNIFASICTHNLSLHDINSRLVRDTCNKRLIGIAFKGVALYEKIFPSLSARKCCAPVCS